MFAKPPLSPCKKTELVGDQKILSVVFLPKVSAKISAETLSVFKGYFGISAERALSAERHSFCRNKGLILPKLKDISAERASFSRNGLFRFFRQFG